MVEFLIFLYTVYVSQLATIPLTNAIAVGICQVITLLLCAQLCWLVLGKHAYHGYKKRKPIPILIHPSCYRCQDTGFLPNRLHIGGYPHLCICSAGSKKKKEIHNTCECKPRKQTCLSCGDTGLLSFPGVKTVPCGCIRGNFYRTLVEVRCLK